MTKGCASMDTPEPNALIAQSLTMIAQTYRLGLRLQGWALALLALGLAGFAWLLWQTWNLSAASNAHTQALLDLLRRMSH
jgi:type VI protein secretion system component VasF